jgi:hypothetical protein
MKLKIGKGISTVQEYLLKNEGKRFCTSCQRHQPIEGGYKKPNSSRGWSCKNCIDKTSISIYATKDTKRRMLNVQATRTDNERKS